MSQLRFVVSLVGLALPLACSPVEPQEPAVGEAAAAAAVDPAPPQVRELEPIDAPRAESFDRLRSTGRDPGPRGATAGSEDWPGFLGPRRDGRCAETGLTFDWPAGGPPLLWAMERGEGYAAPAIAAGRLVYTHRMGGDVHIECLEPETGRRFWAFTYPITYRGRYIRDSGPRATAQIDGEWVYVHGVEGQLHCLELTTGRVRWRRDLKADFGLQDEFFGVVGSPLISGDDLVINLGAREGPTVAAFDKHTGRLRWGAGDTWGTGCPSPVRARVGGAERLLVLTGGVSRPPVGGLLVLDLDGAITGRYPFRSRVFESVNGATPVVAGDDLVFLTSAYGVGSAGLRVGDDGSIEELWKQRRPAIEFANPIVAPNGKVYLVDGVRDRFGAVLCMDPTTGERLSRTEVAWEEGPEGDVRDVSLGAGSLLWVQGGFLALGDNGGLCRLELADDPGAELRLGARAALFWAGETWTPLVVHRGLLYVCQNAPDRESGAPRRLLCYDLRGG